MNIIDRFAAWYENPNMGELGWDNVMKVRTEAHAWITELRVYQADPEREFCVCSAIEAAIDEFTWTQQLLNKVGFQK